MFESMKGCNGYVDWRDVDGLMTVVGIVKNVKTHQTM